MGVRPPQRMKTRRTPPLPSWERGQGVRVFSRRCRVALTDRQRGRMRSVLETLLRAEETVAAVADERARVGETGDDAALDRTAALLRDLIAVVEPLVSGERRR